MMHIKDQRFLTFQNDTELILRTSKGKGIAFSLHLETNDVLMKMENNKEEEFITIDEANEYFFVTTQNNEKKAFKITLKMVNNIASLLLCWDSKQNAWPPVDIIILFWCMKIKKR